MTLLPRRYNDLFDEFFETPFRSPLWGLSMLDDERVNRNELSTWMPQTDVSETDKAIKITANLPGMKKDDIKIEFDEDTRSLKLHGEYKQEKKDEGEKFHRVERRYGRFDRSFTLPRNVDADHITANVTDGVLYVEVPKIMEKKKTARAINIQ